MSKEAVGYFNTKIGSSDYWSKLNHSTMLGTLMDAKTNYWDTLRAFGEKASAAIDEIYEDLSNLGTKIRFLPSSDRSALAKQVEELYDVCKMTGASAWHSSDCVQGLNLSAMSPWVNSFRDNRGTENAIRLIKSSPYSGSEVVSMLQEAAKWSISSAAGSSQEKELFLLALAQGKDGSFLQDVAEEYQNQTGWPHYEGSCGYAVGSRSYLAYIENLVFGASFSVFASPDYERLLRDAFRSIAEQLERDLDNAIRENDYITDETAAKLKDVASELNRCGVSTGSLTGKIEKLAWFVGGDPAKIKDLQRALNNLGIGQSLKEDGVYGEKTQNAWLRFVRELEHGPVPTLRWVDLLQSKKTGIEIDATTAAENAGLHNAFVYGRHPFIRIDPPHSGRTGYFRGNKRNINYNHINIAEVQNSNRLYEWLRKKYNHYPLDDRAYNALKDLKTVGKKVRITGKVLLVAGIALDALELGLAVNADLKDADRKLGKPTVSTVVSIGGSWAGAALLAKAGATIGAATGPVAPVAIPVLSVVGGIVGSFGGSRFAQWIVDITCVEE